MASSTDWIVNGAIVKVTSGRGNGRIIGDIGVAQDIPSTSGHFFVLFDDISSSGRRQQAGKIRMHVNEVEPYLPW